MTGPAIAGQGTQAVTVARKMRAAYHLYTQAGFTRLPGRDWSPRPGEVLLAYGLVLAS
jgi:hypothetical protein